MNVENNKFHKGAPNGKRYWLTPPYVLTTIKTPTIVG